VLTTLRPFPPFAKMNSIHLILAIVAAQGWVVHQMDVKSAFLHGDLHEEIYMEQPQGFVQDSSLVCRLWKSLYGLKQAPRAWYAKMDSFLLSVGFSRCHSDLNVYILRQEDALLFLALYVDDLIVTGSTSSIIASIKTALHDRFSMTDLGLLHYFLGLRSLSPLLGSLLHNPSMLLIFWLIFTWLIVSLHRLPFCLESSLRRSVPHH
jgi:hypothetical protein